MSKSILYLNILGVKQSIILFVLKIIRRFLPQTTLIKVKRNEKILTQSIFGKSREDFKFTSLNLFLSLSFSSKEKNSILTSLNIFILFLPQGVSVKISKEKI